MLRKKFSSPRIWLWIIAITLFIGAIVGGTVWYFGRQWKPLFDEQLKSLVIEASDSLYRIEYSKFNLNAVTGNAEISDFKLIPNKAVYQKLVRLKKAPDNIYDLSVKNITINNFHPKQLYSEKKLNISSILISKPNLFITNRRQDYNDTISVTKPKSLYQIISKVFKEVRVDKIILRDIDFAFDNRSDQPFRKTAVKNLNISVNELLIDSLSETDKNRFYYTKNVDFQIDEYAIATADKLYYLTFKNLSFSSFDKRFMLDKLLLTPRYSKINYYKKVGYAKDWFNIAFSGISINQIDLKQFLRNQKLYAESMNISKASVEVYNNMAYRKIRKNKSSKFPHQQLQKLSLNLKIDTLNLKNGYISYSEYNPTSKSTGKITFNNASGKFYNVTNEPLALKKNNLMKASLTTLVMGKGRLNSTFTFNLTDKNGAFTTVGTLNYMDGRAFNNITKPLGLIEVKEAQIKKMKFYVKGNEKLARGTMQFYYDNLNVLILKRDEETGKLKKQGLISQVANILVLNESNPNIKGKFTPGTIYYERPNSASFFNFLWQSLFTGIKESVGVSAVKETKLRKTVTKIGGFIDRFKEKREERKTERVEKREERKKKKEIKEEEKAFKKNAKEEAESE